MVPRASVPCVIEWGIRDTFCQVFKLFEWSILQKAQYNRIFVTCNAIVTLLINKKHVLAEVWRPPAGRYATDAAHADANAGREPNFYESLTKHNES